MQHIIAKMLLYNDWKSLMYLNRWSQSSQSGNSKQNKKNEAVGEELLNVSTNRNLSEVIT